MRATRRFHHPPATALRPSVDTVAAVAIRAEVTRAAEVADTAAEEEEDTAAEVHLTEATLVLV